MCKRGSASTDCDLSSHVQTIQKPPNKVWGCTRVQKTGQDRKEAERNSLWFHGSESEDDSASADTQLSPGAQVQLNPEGTVLTGKCPCPDACLRKPTTLGGKPCGLGGEDKP